VEALQAGLKFARRDVRLTIAMNKLVPRRTPVLSFLGRTHPINRQLGILRHRTLSMLGKGNGLGSPSRLNLAAGKFQQTSTGTGHPP